MIPATLPFMPFFQAWALYKLYEKLKAERDDREWRQRNPDGISGPGLHFLSLLRAPGQVSGWFDSWHAVWTGKQWLGPRKLSSDAASEWHIDALEANSHHTPFANIQLHKWTGSKWQRVA